MPAADLLVRGGEVRGTRADVRVRAGIVVEVGADLDHEGEPLLHATGEVLPGLHDHHLHLHALAAAMGSLPCGPPRVLSYDGLVAALRQASRAGRVRGVGYHESVAGPLDRDVLDAIVPDVPVRVQHRTGAAWFLNSAALRELDPADVEQDGAGRPTGRVLRGDHLLRADAGLPDLTQVGRLLARAGVTGVTDATPGLDLRALQALRAQQIPQRVLLLGAPLDETGDDVGPWKVVLDESAGLDLEAVVDVVRRCRQHGRAVAFHAVTAAEAVVALTALRAARPGRGDRIEHGSLLPLGLEQDLRELGVTVVTQPHFVAERGDAYLTDVEPRDVPLLYRCRSLLDAGVPMAVGTDAPYGSADPWATVRAATSRTTVAGATLGSDERLPAGRALELLLSPLTDPGGPARQVRPGVPADLCVLDAPLATVLREPTADRVAATVVGGDVVHR